MLETDKVKIKNRIVKILQGWQDDTIRMASNQMGGKLYIGASLIADQILDISELAVVDREAKQLFRPVRESPQDRDAKKNDRARANALMDAECLHFLRLFNKHKNLSAEDLNSYIGKTKDWLKIATLIRADYLEALDSMVRITPEGLAAWEQLNQLKKLSG